MTLTLAAAPLGARVGYLAAGDGNQQVLITVAPKTWRTDPRKLVTVPAWPPVRHHNIVLYETDRLHVTAPEPTTEQLLARCIQTSRRTVDGSVSWDRGLLALDVTPRAFELANGRRLNVDDETTVTDLLRLFERLDLIAPDTDDLTGTVQRSPLHRPLIYRRLLEEVSALINSARRGYRLMVDIRVSVRGKIATSSIVRHSATGDPRLVCHYDELTTSTLLLGIICTGLEWIADGHNLRSPFGGRFSNRHLRHDAVTLRRALGDVAALPPATARLAGPRLHLNRLDRAWASALQLTLTVLAETEHVTSAAGSHHLDPVELSIPTDKLWERIVHQTLRRSGFQPVLDPRLQPIGLVADPWLSDPPTPASTRPDNVAWRGDDIWIIDAKYKMPSVGPAPARADQYQMFAYSHLVADPGTVQCVVLVYPGVGPTQTWQRGPDQHDQRPHLLTLRIPFPHADQVRTETTWQEYLDGAAEQLRTAIGSASTSAMLPAQTPA